MTNDLGLPFSRFAFINSVGGVELIVLTQSCLSYDAELAPEARGGGELIFNAIIDFNI